MLTVPRAHRQPPAKSDREADASGPAALAVVYVAGSSYSEDDIERLRFQYVVSGPETSARHVEPRALVTSGRRAPYQLSGDANLDRPDGLAH